MYSLYERKICIIWATLRNMFSINNDNNNNDQNSCIKRNFGRKKNISKFCKYIKNESWDNIYYSSTQEAFTEFQGLINSYFEKASRNTLLL